MPTARFPIAPSQENVSSTLNGAISAAATSIIINDASKLTAPCYLVIDRVDANSNVQATSLWEYILVTAIASNTLTVTRAQGGSTGQSHNNGAVIEAVVTAAAWEDQRTALQTEHDTGGLHVISTATITRINLTSIIIGRVDISTASVTGAILSAVWQIPGNTSSASVGIGPPLIMSRAGTWNYFNLSVQSAVSAASLTIQVVKNAGTNIFAAGVRPNILGGGTFSSSASVTVTNFAQGDIFTINLDTGGWYNNLTVQGFST